MSLAADMLAYRNLIESLTKQSKRVINSIFGVEKLFCLGKSKTSPVIPATTECCPISSRSIGIRQRWRGEEGGMQLDNEILSPPAHPVHWSCAFVDLLYPVFVCI